MSNDDTRNSRFAVIIYLVIGIFFISMLSEIETYDIIYIFSVMILLLRYFVKTHKKTNS